MNIGTIAILCGMMFMLQPFYHRTRVATWDAKQRAGVILNQAFRPTRETPPEIAATVAKLSE